MKKVELSQTYLQTDSKTSLQQIIHWLHGFISFQSVKLDGVVPLMTDPPPTNFTSFSKKKKFKKKFNVTQDM